MSNNPKIIDAIAEPVQSAAATAGQSVPLKIDTSQMQQVLQSLVAQQMGATGAAPSNSAAAAGVQTSSAPTERINPSVLMRAISEEMERLYARFDALKRLAVELNGRQLDAPIPSHVKIKNLVINFSLLKDGKEEEYSAEMRSIISVGDITNLLSTEFGVIILALTEQAKQLQDLAQKTGERCSVALQEWENNNKDKKIVRTEGEGVIMTTGPDPVNSSSDAPITLGAT